MRSAAGSRLDRIELPTRGQTERRRPRPRSTRSYPAVQRTGVNASAPQTSAGASARRFPMLLGVAPPPRGALRAGRAGRRHRRAQIVPAGRYDRSKRILPGSRSFAGDRRIRCLAGGRRPAISAEMSKPNREPRPACASCVCGKPPTAGRPLSRRAAATATLPMARRRYRVPGPAAGMDREQEPSKAARTFAAVRGRPGCSG